MFTAERLSIVHMVHQFTTVNGRENKRVNLVFRTPDNRWVLSKLSAPEENVKKIMGIRSPSGETTLFLNNPFMIANSLEELTVSLNSRLNLTHQQEKPLLPIDFESYNDLMDKKNTSVVKITPNLLNDFFKAVGIDLTISSVKKRRNYSTYYVQLYTYNNEYISFNLHRESNNDNLQDFVNLVLKIVVQTLCNRGKFASNTNIQTSNCINDHGQFASPSDEYLLDCLKSMVSTSVTSAFYDALRKSIIRYRETFIHYDFKEKIVFDEFMNLLPDISNNIGAMNDYGVLIGNYYVLKQNIWNNTNTIITNSFNGTMNPLAKTLQDTLQNNIATKVASKVAEVSNWYDNMVAQLQKPAA